MEIQIVLSFGFNQCEDWGGMRENSKMLRKSVAYFVLILDRISSSKKRQSRYRPGVAQKVPGS
jgi:hypothetical protein